MCAPRAIGVVVGVGLNVLGARSSRIVAYAWLPSTKSPKEASATGDESSHLYTLVVTPLVSMKNSTGLPGWPLLSAKQ